MSIIPKTMKIYNLFCFTLLVAILVVYFEEGSCNPQATPDPDDDDWDEEDDDSVENSDDGRVYKNPRNSPSSECPRDEEQATLLGQKCLRKCSSDEDCKSKKKKCLCDGACGMSCIKPERECPELPNPTLGAVTLTGRNFSSRAIYSCPHGYHVVGLHSRLCQAYGHWSGTEPACKQNIYCLAPPTIEHARHSALPEQSTFDLDSTVQYHCHTGYATNGFPRAKCLAIDGQASWYGPDISCEPRSCGTPSDPAHGWHAGECYTFGCRITYHCGDGYELVGKQERFCQADGSWSPKELPTCVLVTAVQCPAPDSPKNGRAIYTSTSYNSVVSYECRYGYTLVGESSRRCGADKKWSGTLPVCKEINCGHPGSLYNGWLENIESGTGLGASIIFRCHPEMLLVGNTSTVCQIDGRWRYQLPLCLAPCVVPTILQGIVVPLEMDIPDPNATTTIVSLGIGSSAKVKHGTVLEVVCDEHYEFPLTSLAPPTCNNGTWSVIPRCVPARCKTMPKPPKFGMVIAPKTEHGMKARFKCKDGWVLTSPSGKELSINDNVLTCSFGNWTGETPVCQEVYCQFPGYIANGKVLLVGNMGLYDYRPYVRKVINNKQIMYDCDKGYVLENGPSGATCIGGKWSPPELPECLPGQHPRLRWNRKRRSLDKKFIRSRFILNHYRNIHRNYYDHMPITEFIHTQKRSKRSVILDDHVVHRGKPMDDYMKNKKVYKLMQSIIHKMNRKKKALSMKYYKHKILKRDSLDEDEAERAYSKYYEKIKARYRKYVRDLFKEKPNNNNNRMQANSYNNPETFTRYRASVVTLPNINDPTRWNKNDSMSNNYPSLNYQHEKLYNKANAENSDVPDQLRKSNLTTIIAQLKSQIVRRKRDAPFDDDGKNEENEETTENRKNKKVRLPCEPLASETYMKIEIIRPSKDPNEAFGQGMIAKVTCDKNFNSNLANANSTVKCVRGRWKPVKPQCTMKPCFVPSTEHGKYYSIPLDPLSIQVKPTASPLTAMDSIENGQVIAFQCDAGYNIQGPGNLRCWNGDWAVSTNPECLPAPCVLPQILHALYQGGYRAGLTIAHGSHVIVHCENGAGTTSPSVQMDCALGTLTPQTINCGYVGPARKSREDEENTNFIVEGGNITDSIEEIEGKVCGHPSKDQAMLIYKNGDLPDGEDTYPAGTEISFNCITSLTGEKSTWKIVCEDGNWIARASECGDEDNLSAPLANGSCLYRNHDPHVVSFYNDLAIRENSVEFPAATEIISRCVDIGKYMMIGSSNRTCVRSRWTGQKPRCFGLNQENDYAMEKPPTILFRHQNGPIAQSNDGKLVLYPGTTIHMECLWMRRFGTPKWNVSHENRKYPEGWNQDEGRDPQLEYRLSIFHAVKEDSGIFTCITPARHTHSVEIIVKPVHCEKITPRRGLALSTTDTMMGTKVHLSCNNGNALIGTSEIICLASGNWSAPLPVCESVECGEVPINPSLVANGTAPRVAILSREVGGRAAFSCPAGHGLKGSSEAVCLPSGDWGGQFPTCAEVQCFHPGAPQNGYAQGQPPYRAGDVVQFNCNPEYMMQGQPIIACQDNGRWSGPLPKCVQACSYPGTAISGRMSSVKFYYTIGESITFTCDSGLELRGAKMLKCLKNGKWSSAIPTCINPDAVNSPPRSQAKRSLRDLLFY